MNTKFGFFVKCPSMEMIEAIGISGCDFAVVDMEHTPLGPRDLYPLLLAAERRNVKNSTSQLEHLQIHQLDYQNGDQWN